MEVSTEKPLKDTKIHNFVLNPLDQNKIEVKNIHLTTKRIVEFLVSGTLKDNVCRSCLKVTTKLTSLSQVLEVANDGALYKVPVQDMIQSFYPYPITEDSELPNKICNKCLERTINLYLFNLQYKQSVEALRSCLNEIYDSVTLLDPIDRPKIGRQKIHLNHNVVHVTYKYVKHYAQALIQLSKKGEFIDETMVKLNKYECPKCWEVLPSLSSFLNHEKTHPKNMWLKCRICGLSFSRKISYRRHLKEHENNTLPQNIKSETLHPTETKKVEEKFECKSCATISDNYITHLQHVETHKFKKVLDNLLNKRAVDLCTVCLDSKKDMVSVDKTVALHGGCEELMGDRTVDNILAASFPDQPSKHYKYQELFIPSPAKIIKITPRKSRRNNIINVNDNKNASDKENKPFENFRFTKPSKIITDTKFTENVPVVFEFSKPIELFIKDNVTVDQAQINDLNDKSIDIEKPKEVKIVEDIALLDSVLKTVPLSNKTESCKYCWLFAKTVKCDFCKKINETAKESNPIEDDVCNLDEQLMKVNKTIDVYPKIQIEDKKWQCQVCLTSNNADSKLCFCCDAQINIGEVHTKTRVFERQNTLFFEDDTKGNDGLEQNNIPICAGTDISQDITNASKSIDDYYDIETGLPKNSEEITDKHNNSYSPEHVQKTDHSEEDIRDFKYLSEDRDHSEFMDICEELKQENRIFSNPIQCIKHNITKAFEPIEEMSVDQNDLNELKDIKILDHNNIINVPQTTYKNTTTLQPFQFNIGASNSSERRIKKTYKKSYYTYK